MSSQLLITMHYYLASVVLESYYPHSYLWVHFMMASPFSPVLQKKATAELLSDAGSPLISIASVSPMQHNLLVGFPVLNKIPTLAGVLFISETCLPGTLKGDDCSGGCSP